MVKTIQYLLICLTCTTVSVPTFANNSRSPTDASPHHAFMQASHPLLNARSRSGSSARLGGGQRMTLAGLNVIVWQPESLKQQASSPAPLVIFSHGYHGDNSLSVFLMKALAQEGYLVVAPNHKDALSNGFTKKQIRFGKPDSWSENTYKDREEDIKHLIGALRNDETWRAKIDWSKLALVGHSLGGYTVLGLAGAWPSWKLPGIKAVLALAPYTNPYLKRETLGEIDVPVMYQCGTRDIWINMFVKGKNGAFNKTPSPSVYVEFDNASHFTWTNLNVSPHRKDLVCHYSLEFLNKYVKGDSMANPEEKLSGVSTLQTK
ncbi:MAG TPA: hypothetical protein EYN91_06065 [Candidatus Melainabacteria bacterium]|nr:hypothetical protein [Candidatus Melainabacteria bacterium]